MKKVEDKRSQAYQSEVKGTSIKIDYRASIEPTDKGEEVASIYGTITKDGKNIGNVSYEKVPDRMHITFEPFSGTTFKEKQAITAVVLVDVNEVLTTE